MKLENDIYAYEWTSPFENNCNSFFVGGNVGALIDPGLTTFFPDLLKNMAEDGIYPKDIKYIINTHSHPDHFQASGTFTDNDTKIGMHRDEIDFLNKIGSRMYAMFGLDTPQVVIDMPLDEGSINIGDETFEVIHTPGHSPGSISLYWPAKKALFPGDVIFNQNVGRTDFPGGSSDLLKESIMKISQLDVDYLMPGHMGIIVGNEDVKKNFQIVIKHILPYI